MAWPKRNALDIAAFIWGVAEAMLFFLVPDVLLSYIGIKRGDRERIVQGLSALLADSYTLYLMTHNFHWNVTGPYFNTLHTLFQTQYEDLALANDLIAERLS